MRIAFAITVGILSGFIAHEVGPEYRWLVGYIGGFAASMIQFWKDE